MLHDRSSQRAPLRNLWALAQIVGHVASPWRRSWRVRWGTRPDEATPDLLGEDLIPTPNWACTHAVSIAAPPERVWPWIVQVGQGRGGFYSYELLENLIGCRIENADTIRPELQTLALGDEIRLHPKAPALHVAALDTGRSLVLRGKSAGKPAGATDSIWAFHLSPEGPGRSRLVERGKNVHGTTLTERLFFSPLLAEPVGFVMSREMLRGIKARAERAAAV
jgi:hypothetical protein